MRDLAGRVPVLRAERLVDHAGVAITDVACRLPAGRGHREQTAHHAIVFVRRGSFVRHVDGTDHLLDPTHACCIRPGEEQRYDHEHDHGDDCTSVRLDPAVVASLWGGDVDLPTVPVPTAPAVDLHHRLLLAAARRGAAPDELYERTLVLVGGTLGQVDPRRVASGRPATQRARRVLVDAARQALAADPGRSLPELAAALGVSPYHLSRTFHAGTGHTVTRHRRRLRVRDALERLAEGEDHLAALAADLGFADQSHLCRAVRDETGRTPSALRRALGGTGAVKRA